MLITEPVLILHRFPFSETSLIIKAIGKKSGPISIMAKGALRPKNSLAHTLEPLNLCEFTYIYKQTRELQTLKEAQIINNYQLIRKNLEKQAYAHVIAEILLRAYTHPDEPQAVFQLAERYFRLLNTADLHPPRSLFVLIRFIFDFCELLGFGLQLSHCIECGMNLDKPPASISPNHGGAICHDCHSLDNSDEEFNQALFEMNRKNFMDLSPGLQKQIEKFMLRYLCLHLHHDLKINSMDFLQDIRG
jgi:DNA repair protein RecO (recombination protein O)